jgi:predicted nucleic acid-binding protein
MLVLDANVVVAACVEADGFAELGDSELVAPPLMWSEVFSLTHEGVWRGELSGERAGLLLDRLEASPLRRQEPERLQHTAWQIADQLGQARTYDAEYVALAQILSCRLVTLDLRLRRGAERLGFVVTPAEL